MCRERAVGSGLAPNLRSIDSRTWTPAHRSLVYTLPETV